MNFCFVYLYIYIMLRFFFLSAFEQPEWKNSEMPNVKD